MKHGIKPRTLLLPVCWFRGHRPEGESIIQTQLLATNYIKRCGRCGRYIFRSSIGEMTLTRKVALDMKARHDKALEFPAVGPEAQQRWRGT